MLAAFAIGVLVVGVPAAALGWIRAIRQRSRDEAEALANGRILKVDDRASYRGTTGDGPRAHGTGCLVLTDRELRFVQWWPHAVITVPRDQIEQVDTTDAHLGRTTSRPMLRVRGPRGVACWEVGEIDGWRRLLVTAAGAAR